jgi:hypothetical protein
VPSVHSSQAVDFTVENHGSIFLIRCYHEQASEALAESVEPDAHWFGDALAVEPRYVASLVAALHHNGWSVR